MRAPADGLLGLDVVEDVIDHEATFTHRVTYRLFFTWNSVLLTCEDSELNKQPYLPVMEYSAIKYIGMRQIRVQGLEPAGVKQHLGHLKLLSQTHPSFRVDPVS